MNPSLFSRVSVVIPAYNEEHSVAGVVRTMRETLEDRAQIIVVDDGSSDETALRATEAGAEVIALPHNRGKGRALETGFAAAQRDFVVTIDADGQDDPRDTPLLLAKAVEGIDLVIGSRFLGRFHPGAISMLNKAATHAFNTLINVLYGANITDSQAGFRCFSKELLDRLPMHASEYEVETEMLVRTLKLKARVEEVPVRRFQRTAGVTSFGRVRHGLRILSTVLRNRVS